MEKRRLGPTDFDFTTVGLGTWAIGGGDWKFGWGPQDEQAAIAAIHRAVDLGVNWIDTAAVYGFGRSEELVGRALADIPTASRPYVATKCGRVQAADGAPAANIDPDSIAAECDDSLRRLGVEAIDLYQMHWPQPEEDVEAGWTAMVELKRQGKVREIGVCNYALEHLRRISDIHPAASLQPPYSMLRPQVEAELLPYCEQHGIGLVGYSPMERGLLTGGFTAERAASLDESDHRSRVPDFQQPRLGVHLQLVEELKDIAASAGRPVAHLAIAWLLRKPATTSAIVGARSPQQIEQTAGAADWRLSADEIAAVEERLARHATALDRLS